MAGPWERYAPAAEAPQGPWTQYAPERGVVDKLFGVTGERVQTWPERAVREVLSIPERTMQAAASAPPGSRQLTENLIPVTTEAAAIASPVNPAIRAGERVIPGVMNALRPEKPVVPSAMELKTAGAADIKAARSSPLQITPSAVADYSRKVQQELFDSGIGPIDAPATFAKLKDLENAPAGSIFTPGNLQTLRESLSTTAQNFNPTAAKDQLAASRAIKGFDQFLPSAAPKDVMAGAASAAPATREQLVAQALEGRREAQRVAGQFERGRGNYAAAQRSNDITGELDRAVTGILERAEGRAQAANSGRNLDNTIRSRVEAILEKPKEISGLSDAEIAALERVRDGGFVRNTARYVGNYAGGGGGMGQMLATTIGGGTGAAVGGVPGAIIGAGIPAVVGAGGKMVANRLARRDLRGADELMRQRSPLYRERVENPAMVAGTPEPYAAVIRALMANQAGQGVSPEQQVLIDAMLGRRQ